MSGWAATEEVAIRRSRKGVSRARGEPAVVDSRKAVNDAKKQARSASIVGFGCPAVDWPHHVRVVIPADRKSDIRLIEDFGILGHSSGSYQRALKVFELKRRNELNIISFIFFE